MQATAGIGSLILMGDSGFFSFQPASASRASPRAPSGRRLGDGLGPLARQSRLAQLAPAPPCLRLAVGLLHPRHRRRLEADRLARASKPSVSITL
jgi:hypothetical protein